MLQRRFGPEVRYLRGQKKLKNMGKERNGGESGGPPDDPKAETRSVDSRVARRRQDPIGRRLRKFYEDVVEESVPNDFLSILEDADGRQGGPAGGGAGGELTETVADGHSSQPER